MIKRTPVHINFKYRCQVKTKFGLKVLKIAIKNAQRHGLRVIHFSLQSNPIHLLAEADSNNILTKGMRALTVTFAKGFAKGRVQIERYHLHVLKTLKETKNAFHYVLFNEQKHSSSRASTIDGYSSLLHLPNALKLIRDYVKEKKTTLVIKDKGEDPELFWPESFFMKKALG